MKKLFVYPIEYPYGRMICHEARRVSPKILMTGYQMGPVSLRRLEQIRSKCERREALVSTTDMVMPDEMYVEDEFSRKVYEANGYQNVVLMDRVFRCEYLRFLAPDEGRSLILLATGLHDRPSLLNAPQLSRLRNDPGALVVKLHPRSGHYAEFIEKCMERGLKVVEETIGQLLPRTKKLFATYSSVALEARALGIEVEIIDIPGRINTLSFSDR